MDLSPGPKNLGPLIGAIDQGTSSSRFLVFTSNGELVTYHQLPVTTINPQQGWAEVDPIELLSTVLDCIDTTVMNLKQLDVDPQDIVAIGLTNQRETTVVWDKETGKPLYNAILWNDVRTQQIVERMNKKTLHRHRVTKSFIQRISGLPISTYFSALKLRWLFENVKEVEECFGRGQLLFGTVDSWLMWNLTGGMHFTDVTNASRTLLMNLETLEWDPVLCSVFQVPMQILPKIKSSSEIYATLEMSSLKGVPLASCIGDQQAALVGQNCFRPGQAKCTYGTGAFMLCNVGPKIVYSEHGLLSTVGYKLGKKQAPVYALEGSVAVAGSGLSWLRSNLGVVNEIKEVEELAAKVEDTGDVYFVPAFSGLFAPYWRSDARGMICGLTQFSCREHICRAILEAVCFQTRDVLEAMQADSQMELTSLQVDGALSQNNLLMQLQADLLGLPILRPSVLETTALGAAFLAGQAEGIEVWDSRTTETSDMISIDKFYPRLAIEERDVRYERWKDALERTLGWVKPPLLVDETSNVTVTEATWRLNASVAPALFLWTTFTILKIAEWMK